MTAYRGCCQAQSLFQVRFEVMYCGAGLTYFRELRAEVFQGLLSR